MAHEATVKKLKTELQPYILRRTKRDVTAGRMPAKKERILRVENSSIQKEVKWTEVLRQLHETDERF